MANKNIDLILVGATGIGKSATGNTILGREAFKRNIDTTSQVRESKVVRETCTFKDKTIAVVDGLSIGGKGINQEKYAAALNQALQQCNNGFTAILIVLKFGIGFSEEEAHVLDALRSVFGKSVIREYGIVVITHKDNYQQSLEDREFKDFRGWCGLQVPAMQSLLAECQSRCVLLSNRTKDVKEQEAQREELVQCVLRLSQQGNRRYTGKGVQPVKDTNEDVLKMKLSRFGQDVAGKLDRMQESVREIKKAGESNLTKSDLEVIMKELDDLENSVSQSSQWIPQIKDLRETVAAKLKSAAHRRDDSEDWMTLSKAGEGQKQSGRPLPTRGSDSSGDRARQEAGHIQEVEKMSVPTQFDAVYAEQKFKFIESQIQSAGDDVPQLEKYIKELGELKLLIQKNLNAMSSQGLLLQITQCEQDVKNKLESRARGTSTKEDSSKKMKLCPSSVEPASKATTVSPGIGRGSASDSAISATDTVREKASPTGPRSLDLLMIGRVGNGQSATGNSITGTGKPEAPKRLSATSATTKTTPGISMANIEGQKVSVIDSVGISGTDDVETVINSLEEALKLCNYEFSALLIILQFGQRFTKEEIEVMRVIRSVLGENVIREYGVCVFTHGDYFEKEAKMAAGSGKPLIFDNWCKEQTGDAKNLFRECSFRCVLFDNRTEDETKKISQRKQLLSIVSNMTRRYSKKQFEMAEAGRQDLMLEAKLPKLKEDADSVVDQVKKKMAQLEKESLPATRHKNELDQLLKKLQLQKDQLQKFGPKSDLIVLPIAVVEDEIKTKIKLLSIPSERREPAAASSQAKSGVTTRSSGPTTTSSSIPAQPARGVRK